MRGANGRLVARLPISVPDLGAGMNFFVIVLSGVLATADPSVLENVQDVRLRHGFGLTARAAPDTVLIGVSDCNQLGMTGVIITADDEGRYQVLPALVVDCQQAAHTPLGELGLAADVDGAHPELNGREAVVVLR